MTALPTRVGVVGAGTMGAGIAQLGCLAGMETFLHDALPDALRRGAAAVEAGLDKGARRGRWSQSEAQAATGRLRAVATLEELASCDLVIEAAPERVELKRDLFERLSGICGEDAVLATNTSSIAISSLAGAAARPELVVGMHFFNPAPLMRLMEVIPGVATGARAVATARATGEAMGKRVILAADGPGFLVNRCGRPFGAEALRLLQERVAGVEAIDRVCRLGGGFRMGPFELMDLVGVDVGYEVARSFHEQSFGEPRWKPSPIQARMAAAGRHGRKTGRGYYAYGDGPHRPEDPQPPAPGRGEGRQVLVLGTGTLARELRELAASSGYRLTGNGEPHLTIDAGIPCQARPPLRGPPRAVLCAGRSLAFMGDATACGFHALPPLAESKLVELTRGASTPAHVCEAVERFFATLGKHVEWVDDGPGLVLGRIVCQLVNEAAFAVGEGVGTAADVDTGLELGLNHPRGPVAWGEVIGLDHVLATIDGLWEERREERYRTAPLLRRAAASGVGLTEAARGGAQAGRPLSRAILASSAPPTSEEPA